MSNYLDGVPKKKVMAGTCAFQSVSPPFEEISSSTTTLRLKLSFEDALKLNIAVDEGVRMLNGLNRARKEGRDTALEIIVRLDNRRIDVRPGKLTKMS